MLLSIKEVEKQYGVPRATLYYLIDIGELPRVQFSARRIFIKKADMDRVIEEGYGYKKQVEELMVKRK